MIAERPTAEERRAPVTRPEPTPPVKSRVLGILFGVFLFFFAGGHALPGMVAGHANQPAALTWIGTGLWWISAGALALAAYGLWGFPGLPGRWKGLAALGAIASLAMLVVSRQWNMWPLMAADLVILSIAVDSERLSIPPRKRGWIKRGAFFLVQVLAGAFWLYGSAVVLLRPWHQNWGATQAEVDRPMASDPAGSRIHLLNHVVTVNAPPEKIWPWLIQLGQDKAGFYSYDWLERAIGDHVYNVYEIRPEWQTLEKGGFVRATQPDYLGGIAGQPGWKVTELVPNRLLVLEGWGAFWLEPAPDGTTRFGVRTTGAEIPFWAAPLLAFGMEPAHFIMERKMLWTLKNLSEGKPAEATQ